MNGAALGLNCYLESLGHIHLFTQILCLCVCVCANVRARVCAHAQGAQSQHCYSCPPRWAIMQTLLLTFLELAAAPHLFLTAALVFSG